MKFRIAFAGAVLTVVGLSGQAPDGRPEFSRFLVELRTQALAQGIRAETVDRAFAKLEPLEVVVERDRSQTETVLTIDQYIQRRLTAAFVRTAKQRAASHRTLLDKVSATYGTPSSLLVAVWGMESNFGRFTGTRPVVQALATLAWEGRRGPFFTSELMDALRILDKGDIELDRMTGSWAGAMGQTQFMPSSYLAHAQDFDGDGRRDIWGTLPDVFASIAGYMRDYGWQTGQAWGREIRVPAGGADRLVAEIGLRESGCRASRELTVAVPLARWQALGVRNVSGGALPKVDRLASLLRAGKTNYLVYPNYDTLLAYNCAHAYALAVGTLANRIAAD